MFVQTKSSLMKSRTGESCETIVFKSKCDDYQTSSKDKTISAIKTPKKKEDSNVDMKKLRYEVIKFGSSGFDVSKKEESRVALAVALGAKPPKKKYRNYIEILAEKKAEKEKSKLNKQKTTNIFSTKETPKWKRNNGNKTRGLLSSYGKVRPSK